MAERLVNVVALLAEVRKLPDMISYEELELLIQHAPSEDIVRCENCEHYHLFDEGFYDCINTYGLDYVRPDSFCSYGRVREE